MHGGAGYLIAILPRRSTKEKMKSLHCRLQFVVSTESTGESTKGKTWQGYVEKI